MVVRLSPLAKALFDSLAERMYTLSKEVQGLLFRSGFGGHNSTTKWGYWTQF